MNSHIVICLKCNTEQEYSFLCKKCGCTLGKNLRLVAQTTEQKKPSNEKLMFCASCDAEISKLAIICPKCDKHIVKQCNTCKRKIAIDNKKCPECGAPEPFTYIISMASIIVSATNRLLWIPAIAISIVYHIGILVIIFFALYFLQSPFRSGWVSDVTSHSFIFICIGYIVMYLFLCRDYLIAITLLFCFSWLSYENFSDISQTVNRSKVALDLIVEGFGYVFGAVFAFGSKLLKKKLWEMLEAKKSNTLSD